MIFTIDSYNQIDNECVCFMEGDGSRRLVDPFIAAYPMTDEEYKSGKGHELVGRTFDVPFDTPVDYDGTLIPHEGEMTEVFDN